MTEKNKSIENYLEKNREILDKFEKWISQQSHLPQNIPRLVLMRFIQVCDFDLEKTKELLEINVRFRSKHSYLFTDRDARSEEIQRAINTVQITVFPNVTRENYHITGFRLINFDSRNFVVTDVIKYIFMVQDMSLVTAPIIDGDVCIFDAKGLTLWHVMRVVASVSTIRLFFKYVQEAAALRLMQNHFVNCSPVLTKLMGFLKPFMKKELSDGMHFHTSGLESLYEFVSPDVLPEEYGGTDGCLEDYFKQTISKLYDQRDYVLNDDNFFVTTE